MNFKEHLKKYLSDENIEKLIKSFDEEEQKGLVLNTNKMSPSDFIKLYPNIEKHRFVDNAFLYNKKDYEFGKNPLFDLGAYYIQDPSAMLVAYYLNPTEEDFVLDLCAAPGGKSIHASLLMNNKGQLLSNDLSSSRAQILLSNVERLGRGNIVVTSLNFENKYKEFLETFDKIILDAPCSGSGMFRRAKEMKHDWSYEKVLAFSQVQKSLLEMASLMLKPGGRLIYSTCSYSYEEDEEVILDFLSKHSDFKTIKIGDDSSMFYRDDSLKDAIHLFPCFYKGEGHFICLLGKEGQANKTKFNLIEFKKDSIDKNKRKVTDIYFVNNLFPKQFLERSLRPGLFVKSITKDMTIPSHAFAKYSSSENSIELTEEEYKKFIHGETLNKNVTNGYAFVSYLGINVGVTKVTNGTLKNFYPKGLRN